MTNRIFIGMAIILWSFTLYHRYEADKAYYNPEPCKCHCSPATTSDQSSS